MLHLSASCRYYLHRSPTDMRKGFDSLCGIVSSDLQMNVLSGAVFIFINKKQTQVKLLLWEGDGLAIYYKRLERGTYEVLPINTGKDTSITHEALQHILQGVSLRSVRKRKDINKRLKAVDNETLRVLLLLSCSIFGAVIETAIDYKVLYEQSVEQYRILVNESSLKIAAFQHELDNLKRLIFGSKNERFIPANGTPSQLTLDIQTDTVAACSVVKTQQIQYTRNTTQVTKHHPGRTKLPEHLERREMIIQPTELTESGKKIGEEITEELDYEPGKLFVNRYVRPKYVQANNQGITISTMVHRPLPKAIVGAGSLAQIIIDKYVDHLPLYRQIERFKREGKSTSLTAPLVTGKKTDAP